MSALYIENITICKSAWPDISGTWKGVRTHESVTVRTDLFRSSQEHEADGALSQDLRTSCKAKKAGGV